MKKEKGGYNPPNPNHKKNYQTLAENVDRRAAVRKQNYSDLARRTWSEQPRRVVVRELGIETKAPHHAKGQPGHLRAKKRGKIQTFSKHSAARLRKQLIEHAPASGCSLWSVCLTIPGPILSPDEVSLLWRRFTNNYVFPSSCAGWWRREQQARGQAHWHLVLSMPSDRARYIVEDLRDLWFRSLDSLGPAVQVLSGGQSKYFRVLTGIRFADEIECVRSAMLGADLCAFDVRALDDGHLGAVKYLLDHTSKRKRHQIASSGRHWGRLGRKHWARYWQPSPAAAYNLDWAQYVSLLRLLRRWNRPRIAFDRGRGVWGTHLGFATHRGRKGASVWFGVSARAVIWARDNPAPLTGSGPMTGGEGDGGP